eukprot:TRINITY_DN1014_c0_g1_i1.p1 TRINITY_DN1014_c0_g1~~TRINITY_DN1014_c0_g1_i1.p1  ORF type:complete len:172 (-),score=5.51 TRINITY_DN1014_c0_g1_i1:38-553(-)
MLVIDVVLIIPDLQYLKTFQFASIEIETGVKANASKKASLLFLSNLTCPVISVKIPSHQLCLQSQTSYQYSQVGQVSLKQIFGFFVELPAQSKTYKANPPSHPAFPQSSSAQSKISQTDNYLNYPLILAQAPSNPQTAAKAQQAPQSPQSQTPLQTSLPLQSTFFGMLQTG